MFSYFPSSSAIVNSLLTYFLLIFFILYISMINVYKIMNSFIRVMLHWTVSASVLWVPGSVHLKASLGEVCVCVCQPLWQLQSRTYVCTFRGLINKKSKLFYGKVNYKNMSWLSFICVYHIDQLYEIFQPAIKTESQVTVEGPNRTLIHDFHITNSTQCYRLPG